MLRPCCTAQFAAIQTGCTLVLCTALFTALAGCGTVALFGTYDLPESPGVAEAPYPRLIDVPEATPPGTYSADIPDPAQGDRVQGDLAAEAVVAEVRRGTLAGPVITDEERARMQRRARRPKP